MEEDHRFLRSLSRKLEGFRPQPCRWIIESRKWVGNATIHYIVHLLVQWLDLKDLIRCYKMPALNELIPYGQCCICAQSFISMSRVWGLSKGKCACHWHWTGRTMAGKFEIFLRMYGVSSYIEGQPATTGEERSLRTESGHSRLTHPVNRAPDFSPALPS